MAEKCVFEVIIILTIAALIWSLLFGVIKPNFRYLSCRKLEWLRQLSNLFMIAGGSVAVYAGVKQENQWLFFFSVCWTAGFLGLGYVMTTWLEDHDRATKKALDALEALNGTRSQAR